MLPHDLQWFYPGKISEALKLLNKEGVILHAGGTRILKTQARNLKGFVDINGLGLNSIQVKGKNILIGSGATFSDVIGFCKKTGSLPGLSSALAEAASTPLRNRITIGGSLKDFPVWSSLYAPLIALDAKLELAGDIKICSVEDYVKKNIIKSKHIIKNLIIPDDKRVYCKVKRFSLIRFEYPLFNIAAACRFEKGNVVDSRIVITGVTGRFHRFKPSEKALDGKPLTVESIAKCCEHFTPKFHSDIKYSEEYREKVAKVFLNDMLIDLMEEAR
jgi:CO/xanthine dehydrogenase FAD-binding subunit